MSKTKTITIQVVILILLGFAIGFLLSQEGHIKSVSSENLNTVSVSSNELVELSSGTKEVKSNKVIISDKFVSEFSANGQVVVLDSTGSAYIVREGVVLAGNEVVIDNRDGDYSVIRLNEASKSISSSN